MRSRLASAVARLALAVSIGAASSVLPIRPAHADPSDDGRGVTERVPAREVSEPATVDPITRDEPRPAHPLRGEEAEGVAVDAEHPEAEGPTRPRRTFRWSDGPRLVPAPRGASMVRARELGLGTRECASRLLHGPPDPAWTRAARGREPERLLWPVDEGRWVRGFGYVRTTRPDLIHRGVDISAPVGTVVRAAADGIVAYSDNGIRGYGNLVMIVHRNGWVTLYAHNARTTVQPGYRVRRGERIALVGTTGITHGPHVHFELWHQGRAIDPSALFDGGPAYVERLASRAARRGEVPAPRPVSDSDRPEESPLAPHPDEVSGARRGSERRATQRRAGRRATE